MKMGKRRVKIEEPYNFVSYTCCRCRHIWKSRLNIKPLSCPKCKSYTWDVEKDDSKAN